MTASPDFSSCPNCHSRTVTWRNTFVGLLYGIFCFPCGIYCCLRLRQQHCSKCDCDVIKATPEISLNSLGYSFRNYHTMDKGVPAIMATSYRNMAYSASIASSHELSEHPNNSQTELV
ncbi:unnamed protein product [Angiostrongylus costaricensis]|uniref:Brain protein I3 n=1 Tax=Angiostrongylus costaricensis TaxID=334426 RepID=A0A0R3PIR2_ANGCS|nr:unnamed protein product [Angiostrongylus costaricensis]